MTIYTMQSVVVNFSEDRSRKGMKNQGRIALAEWGAKGE